MGRGGSHDNDSNAYLVRSRLVSDAVVAGNLEDLSSCFSTDMLVDGGCGRFICQQFEQSCSG